MFIEASMNGEETPLALNFGPDLDGMKCVSGVLELHP
jgi:hypothetical protein